MAKIFKTTIALVPYKPITTNLVFLEHKDKLLKNHKYEF